MHFSNALTIIVSVSFLFISMALMVVAIRGALSQGRQIERRLAGGAALNFDDDVGVGAKKLAKKNLLTQLGSHLTLPDAKEITRLRFTLAQAGYYDENAVKSFLAARMISLFGPIFLLLMFWGALTAKLGALGTGFLSVLVLLLGLLGPSWFIQWKTSKRTDACRRGFPDMMDLMVACIEAGLGLDAALVRVSHELGGRYPALKVNLEIMNLELRAGRDRNQAMQNFATRINLDEAKALAVMIKQSEEMGSSIGKALRTFSEDMRHKRMMRAEEKAMALSAKLTVPLILFIFPTIMVMLLMPAALRIMDGLGI
ncbi:type II secretion system F family protein [Litorimonas sp. RW-G-Af-16]|uniref:type II secretion system F family protein n=1 Tax=Litorimonas sp. RW-G-Af-16 TaxID=3241168 RepID=UPI00390C9117